MKMKFKINIIDATITIGVLLILFYSSDPIIYPDTVRYLYGNLHDPPFYFTIINLMQLIFGSLNSVVVLQTLSIGFGIIYLIRTLSIQFNLDLSLMVYLQIIGYLNLYL